MVCQPLDSPVFASACEHHHDTFPVGTGHLGDIAVDELVVLIDHKVLEVPRCQDSALMTGRAVDSTGISHLIPPGLVQDSRSRQLRLVREKQRDFLHDLSNFDLKHLTNHSIQNA